jgi:hypothetical protein
MQEEGAKAVHAVLAQLLDKVKAAPIDLSKTYTNEFVR